MSITFWMVSSAPEKNCRQKIPPKKAAPLAPSSEVLGASHWEGPKPRSPTSATRPQGSGPGLPINPRESQESRLFPGLYSQGLRWELDLEVHLRDGPSQVVPVAEFWDVLWGPWDSGRDSCRYLSTTPRMSVSDSRRRRRRRRTYSPASNGHSLGTNSGLIVNPIILVILCSVSTATTLINTKPNNKYNHR